MKKKTKVNVKVVEQLLSVIDATAGDYANISFRGFLLGNYTKECLLLEAPDLLEYIGLDLTDSED